MTVYATVGYAATSGTEFGYKDSTTCCRNRSVESGPRNRGANDISKQKSANDTALKKHAECIVDSRGHQLSQRTRLLRSRAVTSLQKRIDSLSSALDQQHVIVSKQNSHDQENRVVNRLESKIQKRFHTLRDDVYEKSMKQQKMLMRRRSLPQIA